MDYDPSCASPNPYGGGGGSIHLVCQECLNGDNYSTDDADDGFFTCHRCFARHTMQATAADPHDFPTNGNIYVRRVATQPTPKLGTRTPASYTRTPQAAAAFNDFAEPSEPRDFAPSGSVWGEPNDLAARVRLCYVQGLQVILQWQLEALVEQHRVVALVCAVAGPLWVRWVATSKVCDKTWVRQALVDHEATGREKCSGGGDIKKPNELKYEWDDDILPQQKDRRKVKFSFLRSLRMMLPLYSTLAICFLACHVAREAILPSDIYRWAMEGNVPYLSAFTEVDTFLGSSLQDRPFDARQLFRPMRVIGAWQLEASIWCARNASTATTTAPTTLMMASSHAIGALRGTPCRQLLLTPMTSPPMATSMSAASPLSPPPSLAPAPPASYTRTPQAAAAFNDFAEPSEPRDFVPSGSVWGEPNDLAARVRLCYVQGLQVILQWQLEALVEQHRVVALVCAVAGPLWVRWVATSKVCDKTWVRQALVDHEATGREKCSGGGDIKKPNELKYEWDDDISPQQKDRRKVKFAFLRSLRMMLPLYSTLAICFLACHVAREAILPSDIYRWAMEGNVPYLSAFTEVDTFLGSSLQDRPFDARQLFRPMRVIGAWQLEAAAGFIAQKVGLGLPPVNFYAIAQRCLKDLLLPIDRIFPHACRIYEWAMPAELWFSSNPSRIPTRVCVMGILIVSLRVMYNINGQGIWENICEEGRNTIGSYHDTNSPTFRKHEASNSEEIVVRELLCAIAAAYDKINVAHDYSSDLHSYLKYCKEVIFTGFTCSDEEKHLTEIFWDMYKAREDENAKDHVKSQTHCIEEMTITNRVKKRYRDGAFVEASCFFASSRHDAMQMLKSEMHDHGFHYMQPRKPRQLDGYLRYRRRWLSDCFVYVAHADYFMLRRAFAKLAEVDVRIMHTSVLKLERRLSCIEEQIERSLNTLRNLSTGTQDERSPVSD